MQAGTRPRRLQGRAPACKRGCALREAARQGDGDQQPRVAATCGCLSRRDLSTGRAFRVAPCQQGTLPLAMHIPACMLAPTLSPALTSCPSVCRQHTGNTRARGRSSAAEGSRVAEGIGHSAGEQQGVLFEGEFQRFSEGGVQSIRSPCCQSRRGSRQAGKRYCWPQAGQVVVIVRL